jgi:hypothetical protein
MTQSSMWSTSCHGEAADTTSAELSALGEHLALCNGDGDGARRVAMHCGVRQLQGLVQGRLVSASAVAATMIGITWLVL